MTDDDKALGYPLFLCSQEGCREECSYPADMLALHNGAPICEDCYHDLPFDSQAPDPNDEEETLSWNELPKFVPPFIDRIEALSAENERLREELAAVYVKLSGRTEHASDCATSNAPAKDPGPCDCGPPDDVRRAIEVELAMTAIANEDASSDWVDGFEHAWKRVRAALGDTK